MESPQSKLDQFEALLQELEPKFEDRNGTKVCDIETALKIASAINEMFPGRTVGLRKHDWYSEEGWYWFSDAEALLEEVVRMDFGLPHDAKRGEISKKSAKVRNILRGSKRPDVYRMLSEDHLGSEGERGLPTFEQLCAAFKGDRYNEIYGRELLEKARIDVENLLARIVVRLDDHRGFDGKVWKETFYGGDSKEILALRDGVQDAIRDLFEEIGVEMKPPKVEVIHTGGAFLFDTSREF